MNGRRERIVSFIGSYESIDGAMDAPFDVAINKAPAKTSRRGKRKKQARILLKFFPLFGAN